MKDNFLDILKKLEVQVRKSSTDEEHDFLQSVEKLKREYNSKQSKVFRELEQAAQSIMRLDFNIDVTVDLAETRNVFGLMFGILSMISQDLEAKVFPKVAFDKINSSIPGHHFILSDDNGVILSDQTSFMDQFGLSKSSNIDSLIPSSFIFDLQDRNNITIDVADHKNRLHQLTFDMFRVEEYDTRTFALFHFYDIERLLTKEDYENQYNFHLEQIRILQKKMTDFE